MTTSGAAEAACIGDAVIANCGAHMRGANPTSAKHAGARCRLRRPAPPRAGWANLLLEQGDVDQLRQLAERAASCIGFNRCLA
ncbi:MAG TPA: hypothetical protein VI074_04545 [Propionibacteriaceae bacterium]